jgi:hypothetical protein
MMELFVFLGRKFHEIYHWIKVYAPIVAVWTIPCVCEIILTFYQQIENESVFFLH